MSVYKNLNAIIAILKAELATSMYNPVDISMAYQPTEQGLPTQNWIVYYPMGSEQLSTGSIERVFDDTTKTFTVTQQITRSGGVQFTGRVYWDGVDFSKLPDYTAMDMMTFVYNTLFRYDITENLLKSFNIGWISRGQIIPTGVVNDKDQYSMECSFDLKYCYNDVITYTENSFNEISGTIKDIDTK